MSTFSEILRTLWAHKLRSLLTMFGIAWGIGSLLLLVGLGEGFRSGNKRELAQFGYDIMFIFPGRAPVVHGQMNSARQYLLTYQDYLDIRKEAPHVRNATPVLTRDDVRAVSEFASANGQVTGIEPQFGQIRYLPIKQGRWLNAEDEAQRRYVIVLGDEMNRNMFSGHPAVGATILLNGIRFEVIGVVERVGRGDNNSTNVRGYIPYSVMSTFFPIKGDNRSPDSISFVNYQPTTTADHLLAQNEVKKIVARNHGFDYRDDNAFEVWDTIQQYGFLPRQRRLCHRGAGSDRSHQHHACGSQRAHPRDWIAQSFGCHQPQHLVSVPHGRSAPDPAKRPGGRA